MITIPALRFIDFTGYAQARGILQLYPDWSMIMLTTDFITLFGTLDTSFGDDLSPHDHAWNFVSIVDAITQSNG
jgi:hypothetical protein